MIESRHAREMLLHKNKNYAQTASCLACQEKISIVEFCSALAVLGIADQENTLCAQLTPTQVPSPAPQTQICCEAQTPSCLACQDS